MIYQRNKKLKIVIYSNTPTDDPETLNMFKIQAYQAGALRYLGIVHGEEQLQIHKFISEINDLHNLSNRLSNFHEYQKEIPSLLNQLEIGFVLIDCENRIWYISPEMREMLGVQSQDVLGHCAEVFHGFRYSCDGCLLKVPHEKMLEKIVLQPIKNRDYQLKYIKIWSHPVYDNNNKMIGIVKSAQDLSNSILLRSMPLDERLNIISVGLAEHERGFSYVRIYIRNDNKMKLSSAYGHSNNLVNKFSITIDDAKYLKAALESYSPKKQWSFFHTNNLGDSLFEEVVFPIIIWPIKHNERLLGFISVSGGREKNCNVDKIDVLEKYVKEIEIAFEEASENKDYDSYTETVISKIDNQILNTLNINEALKILISILSTETNSINVHIRYKDNGIARLLPFHIGEYPKYTQKEWNISKKESIACRVIMSQVVDLRHNLDNDSQILSFREKLEKEAKRSLSNIKSLLFIPLIFMDDCIGVLGLHSLSYNNYTGKNYQIAILVSNKLSVAIYDYIVREKERNAYKDVMRKVVHTLRSPLEAGITAFNTLQENYNIRNKISKIDRPLIDVINYSYDDMATIIRKFLTLEGTFTKNITLENIDNIIENKIEYFKKLFIRASFLTSLNCSELRTGIDVEHFSEVIGCMLLNSVIATNKIGIITVKTITNNNKLVIIIEDNGPGVDELILNKIFKERVSGSGNSPGVGLMYARKVIEEFHKGLISYDETYLKGARFNIELNLS